MRISFSIVSVLMFLGLAAACGGKAAPAAAPAAAEPAAAAATEPSCAEGEIAHDGGCVKECTSDEDCGEGGMCEQLHFIEDDGSMGPVIGNGCAK